MKKALFTIFALSVFYSVSAQTEHINYKTPDADSDTTIVRILMENAPNYFNAPGAPQFTVMGKNRKFYLGIGGYAKGTVSYDLGNPITNSSHFTTNQIPMNQRAGNGGLFQIGAETSTLAINFVGMPGTKHQIGAYFNLNFTNPNYGLFVQNAYATYCGFKVGVAFSLFTDLMAGPPTIDLEGPSGMTSVINTVLDYEHAFNKRWKVGIGLEMPIASYTNDIYTYNINQRIPDIPMYVQYSWLKGGSWVRFSTMLRSLEYRDKAAGDNATNLGWGLKVSGSAKIIHKLTSFYQAVYGEGIANYIQDSNGLGLDMLPNKYNPGELSSSRSYGGYAGLQWNFSKTTFVSATYSWTSTTPKDDFVSDNMYKSAQYVAMNVFWNMGSNIQMGVEYLWGSRRNMDDRFRSNNRIQTMLQVNF